MSAPKSITLNDLPQAAWDACVSIECTKVQLRQMGALRKAKEIVAAFEHFSTQFTTPEAEFVKPKMSEALNLVRLVKDFLEHFQDLGTVSPALVKTLELFGIKSLNSGTNLGAPDGFTRANSTQLAKRFAGAQAFFLSSAGAPSPGRSEFVVQALLFLSMQVDGADDRLIPMSLPAPDVDNAAVVAHLGQVYDACAGSDEFELLEILFRFSIAMDRTMDLTFSRISEVLTENEAAKRTKLYSDAACMVGLEYQSFWPFGDVRS